MRNDLIKLIWHEKELLTVTERLNAVKSALVCEDSKLVNIKINILETIHTRVERIGHDLHT